MRGHRATWTRGRTVGLSTQQCRAPGKTWRKKEKNRETMRRKKGKRENKVFFCEERMRITQNSSQKHCACLASLSTSCTERTRPPTPGSPRRSSSEVANAFCRTRQQTAPPSVNTRPGRSPGGFSVRTSPSVVPNTARNFAFFRPHHPGSSSSPTQFWVFLPLASVPQSHSIGCVCFPQRKSEFPNAMSKSFMMTLVDTLAPPRVGDSTLHGMTSPAQHLAACWSVMAKNVKRTTTRTETAGEGQWQTEAAQQQHPERLRINSHDSIHCECCEWDRCHRTTLGSD